MNSVNAVEYSDDISGIDWETLKSTLKADQFDNGRTAEQLRASFKASFAVCFAIVDGRVIGKARLVSDGVCNAYLVDVWTLSAYRNQGIAREVVRRLLMRVPGQHVYLQADDDVAELYEKLGFEKQPHGMSQVVGKWLNNSV